MDSCWAPLESLDPRTTREPGSSLLGSLATALVHLCPCRRPPWPEPAWVGLCFFTVCQEQLHFPICPLPEKNHMVDFPHVLPSPCPQTKPHLTVLNTSFQCGILFANMDTNLCLPVSLSLTNDFSVWALFLSWPHVCPGKWVKSLLTLFLILKVSSYFQLLPNCQIGKLITSG